MNWIRNLLGAKTPTKPVPPPLTLVSNLPPPGPKEPRRMWVCHKGGIAWGAGWSVSEARTDAAAHARDHERMSPETARAWVLNMAVMEQYILPGDVHLARQLLGLELDVDSMRCA